jgi:hypothetical protein
MAFILKSENNRYQKIILNETIITMDGVYAKTLVFKNLEEREKDKSRLNSISKFLKNVKIFLSLIEEEILKKENITENEKEAAEDAITLKRITEKSDLIFYTLEFMEKQRRPIQLSENEISIAEKYGFERVWYDSPIIITREDRIWIGPYERDELSLSSLYSKMKKYIYTDQNGNTVVEDDI